MLQLDQISIEIEAAEGSVAIVSIKMPVGKIELIGQVNIVDDTLIVRDAHVQGLAAGALGRSGLNAIGRKLLVVCDVRQVVIFGATRTTGRTRGRKPCPIRFPAHYWPHPKGSSDTTG